MTNETLERAAILASVAALSPPLLRLELLADAALRREFGLEFDVPRRFGGSAVFKPSKILSAAQAAAAKPGTTHKVADEAGGVWNVRANVTKGRAKLVIRSASQEVRADLLLLLTGNTDARKSVYDEQVSQVGCADQINKRWVEIVEDRPLSEAELGDLAKDLSLTPVAVMAAIAEHLDQATLSVDVLVPHSLDYYERLVGRADGQADFKQYASEVARDHIRSLLQWNDTQGLHLALLMGSHSLVTDLLAEEEISVPAFTKLSKWAQEADPVAQGIILELALRRSRQIAKFAPAVGELAKLFCENGNRAGNDSFDVLSAAFTMVDGELGKTRITAGKPPFWRRLAAIAQAALITRCVLAKKRDRSQVINGMRSIRLREYEVQCWVDMRLEPRWQPNFATAGQLRHEVGGRVLMAAMTNEATAVKLAIRDVLLGDDPESLKSKLRWMRVILPGPLEGNIGPGEPLQPEIVERIKVALADASPTVLSFAVVANTALYAQLPQDVPALAAAAIRRANYHLNSQGKRDWVESCLVSLAIVAALNRSDALADELFIVLRNYRRLFPAELDVDAAFRIGMIACASRADFEEWCKCVGGMTEDLAFAKLESAEAGELYSSVTTMCDMVPELWASCGRGIAAFEAVGWA